MNHDNAMLVQLSISQWTARKQDKKVSKEVESVHGAHNAGRFNKDLVNRELLEPITKIVTKARDYHYNMTLPWKDNGERLLPSKLFMQYTGNIRSLKAEFAKAVDNMVAAYPAEVQAARNRLGSMYEPGDYPDSCDVKHKFSLEVEFTPIPHVADFRLDVSAEAQDELKASLTQGIAIRQAGAVKATYARVRDVVYKIAERLGDDQAIFKDSLINNAIELCTVLDGLNITNDPAITALAVRINNELIHSPSVLRNNSHVRARVALAANDILNSLP